MGVVEVPVFPIDADDTAILTFVDFNGDIPLVLKRLDNPLRFSRVGETKHLHEVLVAGNATELVIKGEDFAPHQFLVAIQIATTPDVLWNVSAFEVAFICWDTLSFHPPIIHHRQRAPVSQTSSFGYCRRASLRELPRPCSSQIFFARAAHQLPSSGKFRG